MTARRKLAFALFAALALPLAILSGCAYKLGNGCLFPQHIRTVHVPVFQSDSFRRNLGERLTEAVVREIELRTPYTVVGSGAADSILAGRIVGDTKRVLVESPTDEPRDVELNMQVQVSWVDRQQNQSRDLGAVALPPSVVDVGSSSPVVPEVGQSIASGQQQVIERLAQQIVGLMESPW